MDGGAADGEALGTSMVRDVRLGEDNEPVEEGEVTGKIISNERVNKKRAVKTKWCRYF